MTTRGVKASSDLVMTAAPMREPTRMADLRVVLFLM